MKKTTALALCCLLFTAAFSQKLLSPKEFFGYEAGTHFTPHFQLINYIKSVAQARPDIVKAESYGTTYEGRELLIAYVALPENLKRIEDIRKNNLRIAGILQDGIAADANHAPAIVWLSYNVHGNEPASSEAAMLTLYTLVNDTSKTIQNWLKNTVVIIDPCINPDGRDRYVNWYNSAASIPYNVNPQSREHQEPWPRGRTNHYYFDLNRDWAWQTQTETVQRLKKYNEWLPQIHVDYHEQGYDAPYYFAPAAEPYHEVITQWQRSFQTEIGKNNARYFDKNGWLYFTKQEFDLFYPSYGDTYPIYNGSIGMTYEQGGIDAGLGIRTSNFDTLTLVERVQHHFITGLSTIEMASNYATQLVQQFQTYFYNNVHNSKAVYKTYVLTSNNENKIQAIAKLLDKNNIQYGIPVNKNFKGYNYITGKEETFTDEGYQLAVSALQPKGALIQVLFEPQSKLNDSITYDITAWSLPYAYNVTAYAVKDNLNLSKPFQPSAIQAVETDYGLLLPYSSSQAAQLLAALLTQQVKVRFAEKPFTYNNQHFARGTLIILKGDNKAEWVNVVNKAAQQFHIQPYKVESGFMQAGADFGSSDIKFIHPPQVALITGSQTSSQAVGEIAYYFEQVLHYPLTQINAEDLPDANLSYFNTIIFPDGNYSILQQEATNEKLKSFVKAGGKIIALQDAAAGFAKQNWGIHVKENSESGNETADYSLLKKYGDREKEWATQSIPGAIYKIEIDSTHPLAFGFSQFYYTLKQNAQVYEFLKDGWNVGYLKQNNYVAGFVGSKLKPKIKDGCVFGVKEWGAGSFIFMADAPLFRAFWNTGELLFANALFLTGQ